MVGGVCALTARDQGEVFAETCMSKGRIDMYESAVAAKIEISAAYEFFCAGRAGAVLEY